MSFLVSMMIANALKIEVARQTTLIFGVDCVVVGRWKVFIVLGFGFIEGGRDWPKVETPKGITFLFY